MTQTKVDMSAPFELERGGPDVDYRRPSSVDQRTGADKVGGTPTAVSALTTPAPNLAMARHVVCSPPAPCEKARFRRVTMLPSRAGEAVVESGVRSEIPT